MKKVVIGLGITFIVLIIGFIIYYNTSYFIILNGEKEITINLNEEYKELGAKTIINSKIKIDGLVDNTKVGEYKIKYYHNKKYKERTIKVVDTIKPELVLNGISEVNVVMNGQYIEQGATATDNYDGDITDNIIITNNIDLTKPGEYKVSYQIKDSSNNTTTLDRIVNVSEKGPLSLSIKEFTLDGYFENAILKETEDMGQNYLDETIFYGDSITFNFFYYGQLKQNSIWAMSSLTPEKAHIWEVPFYKYHDEIKFVDGLKKYKPKRVIITLGANSVAVTTKDFFIGQYEELVKQAKEASPTTTIIVQSIFPVDNRFNTSSSLNNTRINNYNYYLAEMCERQGVYFLDTEEVLKDANGHLRKDYCYANDGIHLLPKGNRAVMSYIRTHGIK